MIVDIHERKIFPGCITIAGGTIREVMKVNRAPQVFILPGLVDAHVHIESSMVTPGAFATAAVKHGTVAVVSDPHEIANVLGVKGVKFMLRDAEKVPMKFYFGAPSCVPATSFESSGATIGPAETRQLLELQEIKYLSEMMNFPGVIYNDPVVHEKLAVSKRLGKPIDGHAPELHGEMLHKYVRAGITTDHECSTIGEALEKINLGMKIIIREGSAARNLEELKGLYSTHPEMLMLCSDDLHPEMLKKRHINKLIAGLISEGFDKFDVIRSATHNPVKHYNLENGLLQPGDPADITVVDSLEQMNVLETWINGRNVYENGECKFSYSPGPPVNNFNATHISEEHIRVRSDADSVRVIKAVEGELLTGELLWKHRQEGQFVNADISSDILKIIVKDRYQDKPPAVGFIKGFQLKRGAFASSIAHDSHNIICVGTNDADIVSAVNQVINLKGGLSVSYGGTTEHLQLNIAGIMTTRSCDEVGTDYEKLTQLVKSLGCGMKAPFMTLSFMALLVIPELKISDKGLFDVRKFDFVPLFAHFDSAQ